MNKPPLSQIERLPKWAREYIESLERLANNAEQALQAFTDDLTPSPIYFDDLRSSNIGVFKRYVQTNSIHIDWQGVKYSVVLSDGHNHEFGLRIYWSDHNAVISPRASNSILIHAEKCNSGQ